MSRTPEEIKKELAAFFEPEVVRCKPQTVSGNRALAVFFLDARAVMDRLDAVLGVEGWQDDYEVFPDGNVVCRLRILFGAEWVTKVDVGGPSEQKDGGDRMKAAFSDALKRAAAKFGVGRYLYRAPIQWVDYDPQRKQFTRPPRLPDAFLPQSARKATQKAAEPQKTQEPAPIAPEVSESRREGYDGNMCPKCGKRTVVSSGADFRCDSCGWDLRRDGHPDASREKNPQDQGGTTSQQATPQKVTKDQAISLVELANSRGLPAARLLERYKVKSLLDLLAVQLPEARQLTEQFRADGKALAEWLQQRDAALAGKGLAQTGELLSYVEECARRAGEKREPDQYAGDSIRLAVESANEFARQCYQTAAK